MSNKECKTVGDSAYCAPSKQHPTDSIPVPHPMSATILSWMSLYRLCIVCNMQPTKYTTHNHFDHYTQRSSSHTKLQL